MSIWFKKNIILQDIPNDIATMHTHLDIVFTEIGEDYLVATMPVSEKTRQPYGYLHGGASCVLAETVGSLASALVIDHGRQICLGLEINANHIRSAKEGLVTAIARPLHLGSNTHVWDIRISNEANQFICISRLTVAIVPRKSDLPLIAHL